MAIKEMLESQTSMWIAVYACVVAYGKYCNPNDATQLVIGVALTFPLIYFACYALQYIRRIRCIGREVDRLPGEHKHWLYGNLHQFGLFGEARLRFNTEMAKKYNKVMRVWLGPNIPTVSCMHPDTVKLVLRTDEPKVGRAKRFVQPWLGTGLLVSDGKQWARNRRLITPAFHFDVLKPYVQVYNEATDILISKWKRALEVDKNLEIFDPVSLCALNIILRCAFSLDDDVQHKGASHPYVKCISSIAREIDSRLLSVWNSFDVVYNTTTARRRFMEGCDYAHHVAYEVISKRRATLQESGEAEHRRHLDFLDILLLARTEQGERLTDSEIRQEVDTFLFAGHDTTASAISWCLYALAGHTEHQSKVREELKEVVAGKDGDTIDWDAASGLPYLTRCIKESLRLYPPVPFTNRELSKPMAIEGVTLQPGTIVQVNIWGVNHNEHVWGPDHMEFKPERFLPDNIERMGPYAFTPFSAGPRNCIGQHFAMNEIKVVVGRILLAFHLKRDPDHKPEMVPRLVLKARNGIKLLLTPCD